MFFKANVIDLPPRQWTKGGEPEKGKRHVYDNLIDCLDDKMRAKAIQKAERAIECAGNEPRLDLAVRQLKSLIEKTTAQK